MSNIIPFPDRRPPARCFVDLPSNPVFCTLVEPCIPFWYDEAATVEDEAFADWLCCPEREDMISPHQAIAMVLVGNKDA